MRATQLTWQVVPISEKTTWIFVAIRLDSGSVGWGEATAFGEEAAIEAFLAALAARIAAATPPVPGPVLALAGARPASYAAEVAYGGVEQALLDALAKAARQPLAAMLGGPFRERIPVYANINRGISDRSPAGFARRAREVVEGSPHSGLKIAPFDGMQPAMSELPEGKALFEAGLARVAAVRDAIGPQHPLLIDCHARFDIVGAHRLLDALAPFDIFWIEEPVVERTGDAAAMRHLRSRANAAGVRLAGGESTATLASLSGLLDDGYYDCVLPDLRCTGVMNGLAMLRFAASRGVGVSLHNPVGPVLDAVSRSVAAALPEFMILERQIAESPLALQLDSTPATVVNGEIALGDEPGHGCSLNLSVLSKVASSP